MLLKGCAGLQLSACAPACSLPVLKGNGPEPIDRVSAACVQGAAEAAKGLAPVATQQPSRSSLLPSWLRRSQRELEAVVAPLPGTEGLLLQELGPPATEGAQTEGGSPTWSEASAASFVSGEDFAAIPADTAPTAACPGTAERSLAASQASAGSGAGSTGRQAAPAAGACKQRRPSQAHQPGISMRLGGWLSAAGERCAQSCSCRLLCPAAACLTLSVHILVPPPLVWHQAHHLAELMRAHDCEAAPDVEHVAQAQAGPLHCRLCVRRGSQGRDPGLEASGWQGAPAGLPGDKGPPGG